jgi:hypothetical protein
LPYTEDGTVHEQRRDHPDTMLAFSMTWQQWQTVRRTDIHVEGARPVRELLSIAPP